MLLKYYSAVYPFSINNQRDRRRFLTYFHWGFDGNLAAGVRYGLPWHSTQMLKQNHFRITWTENWHTAPHWIWSTFWNFLKHYFQWGWFHAGILRWTGPKQTEFIQLHVSLKHHRNSFKTSTWIRQEKNLCVVLSCRARLWNSTIFISIIKTDGWFLSVSFFMQINEFPSPDDQRKCFAFRMWVNLQPLPISVIFFSSKDALFPV